MAWVLFGEKIMENVEITVKVNGKEVDLSTISTETFENVKKAVEVKEIPVVRVGSFIAKHDRLIIKFNLKHAGTKDRLHLPDGEEIVAIDLAKGEITNHWNVRDDKGHLRGYNNPVTFKC